MSKRCCRYDFGHRKGARGFSNGRLVPAPKRGELGRLLGEELRANKRALGRLFSIEAGKIESEGLGDKRKSRNHLSDQIESFRIGDKDSKREDDLLDTFCYGIAIGLGNSEGF